MTQKRTTQTEVTQTASRLNDRLASRGTSYRVSVGRRYGYTGIDLERDGCQIDTLTTGLSTREAKLFLSGMHAALDIFAEARANAQRDVQRHLARIAVEVAEVVGIDESNRSTTVEDASVFQLQLRARATGEGGDKWVTAALFLREEPQVQVEYAARDLLEQEGFGGDDQAQVAIYRRRTDQPHLFQVESVLYAEER